MAAQVLSFFQRSPRYAPAPAADWSQQELAEFYRVEAALIRAGIRVGTDRGLSDEKEPWFVFYRTDDGEVVIHFARIDGEYLIAGPAYEEIARGFDFSSMVRNMVARHPLIRRSDRGDNVSIHPAALLVAVVGTAFFKSGEARAAESGATNPTAHSRPALLSSSSNNSLTGAAASAPPAAAGNAQAAYDTVQLPANQAILVLAAALLAADFKVEQSSLEPAARMALAANAAALDFGEVAGPDPMVVTDGDASTAPAHAAAAVGTPAQTASSVLSLVALLSTMPSTVDRVDATEATLGGGSGGAGGGNGGDGGGRYDAAASPLAAPSVHDGADWLLKIRLGAGALPNVEAVQLVRAVVGDTAAAQKIAVIEVSKLPDVLAEILSQGAHVQVAPVGVQPGEQTGDVVVAPEAPSPSTGGDTVSPSEPVGPQKTTAHIDFVSIDLVRQVIDSFMAHTAVVSLAMDGSQVVMYDARITSDPGAITHVTSVTFELPDHSSINLVGDHSAFQEYYGFLF